VCSPYCSAKGRGKGDVHAAVQSVILPQHISCLYSRDFGRADEGSPRLPAQSGAMRRGAHEDCPPPANVIVLMLRHFTLIRPNLAETFLHKERGGERAPTGVPASAMFGQSSQENFFRYVRRSFNLDGLVAYRGYRRSESKEGWSVVSTAELPSSAPSISIARLSPPRRRPTRRRKSDLQELIRRLKKEVDELKTQRKATQRHIAYKR
jgi:hypothetical protein